MGIVTELAQLADNVELWLDTRDPRRKAFAEIAILDFCRTHGRIPINDPAYIEPSCVEHDVVHIHYGGDGWLEIDRGGNVLDLS